MITENRKIYLDILRIIACFLVIVNHTNSQIFKSVEPSSMTWFLSVTYFYICKVAVPIFIMISGVVLLAKQDTYKKVVLRILRIILVIVIFSMVYYINNCITKSREFNISEFFWSIYHSNITNAFWYLYLYIGLLITLPILQRMVSVLSHKDFKYFFYISFVFLGTMPIMIHYNPDLQYSKLVELPIFNAYIGMLLAGYYMEYKCTMTKKKSIVCSIVFVISIALSVLLTYYGYRTESSSPFIYANRKLITVVVPSICMFGCVKYWSEQKLVSAKLKKISIQIGRCTFGIYLLSDLFIKKLAPVYHSLKYMMHPIFAVVIYEVLVFGCGLLVTMILIRIPYIKKIV